MPHDICYLALGAKPFWHDYNDEETGEDQTSIARLQWKPSKTTDIVHLLASATHANDKQNPTGENTPTASATLSPALHHDWPAQHHDKS